MTEEFVRRTVEAQRWLVVAQEDMRVAQVCLDLAEPLRGGAAYHLQQAAEKAIKGFLIQAGQSFRHTHDLQELGSLGAGQFPEHASLFARLGPMTVWATAYRYPSIDTLSDDPPSSTSMPLQWPMSWSCFVH